MRVEVRIERTIPIRVIPFSSLSASVNYHSKSSHPRNLVRFQHELEFITLALAAYLVHNPNQNSRPMSNHKSRSNDRHKSSQHLSSSNSPLDPTFTFHRFVDERNSNGGGVISHEEVGDVDGKRGGGTDDIGEETGVGYSQAEDIAGTVYKTGTSS